MLETLDFQGFGRFFQFLKSCGFAPIFYAVNPHGYLDRRHFLCGKFELHTGRKDPDEPNDFAYSFGGGGAKSDLTIMYWEKDSNNTGGGQSHENRPPYIAVKWMIKAK